MFERLEQIAARYEELGREMASDEVITDHERYQKIAKQHRDLEAVVETFREYQRTKQGIADAQTMLAETDPDIRAMAQEELTQLEERLPKIEEDLKLKLLPKDPNDEKNVILEIRAGTGRRRGLAVRRGGLPHVLALCRAAALEGGSAVVLRVRHRQG